MSIPRATMRLQLHKGFTFDDAAALAPYMARLGISHLYASPILMARADSMHGYDVADPARINPELGGEDGFRHMVAALRAEGLGIIIDIVPNHMAVGEQNPWWQAMLREGPDSRYGRFFDIDWHPQNPLLPGKVLLPVLSRPYGEALVNGEIGLAPEGNGFVATYFDKRFPIRAEDEEAARQLCADEFDPATLHTLLDRQHYRLAFWRTAPDEINWRRFFDINDLAGLRTENPDVFEASHATIFRLYAEGLIDGLRVDHVDGLADPRDYCRRLRARLAELAPQRPGGAPAGPAWIVVEKILGEGESLPTDWQVDGTSGYDFMDLASAVLHDAAAAPELGALWASLSGRAAEFHVEETAARREIIDRSFTAQLDTALDALHRVALADLATRDMSRPAIRRALIALLAHFPVYRAYTTGAVPRPGDACTFARAAVGAEAEPHGARAEVIRQIVGWLRDPDTEQKRIAAAKFQQLSVPVAAKAVEDTAFYRYGRLISRNDVGFAAHRLGIDITEFHRRTAARARDFPAAMLATATHDHKRGEDVRARLAVLSEMPEEWGRTLRALMEQNARFRTVLGRFTTPAPGDEVMLYQMLLGAWPLAADMEDARERRQFAARIAAWQEKALREAKLHTSWTEPDTDYENAAQRFLEAALEDRPSRAALAAFAQRIGPAGAVNGLAQAALKLMSPGVPDFYQGTEFWDQTLVDPDNRRTVDFTARRAALAQDDPPAQLIGVWRDGRVKQALICRLLALRRAEPALFEQGTYEPLQVEGPRREHLIAFARRAGERFALTLVPRCTATMLNGDAPLFAEGAWRGTCVKLPPWAARTALRDMLAGASHRPDGSLTAGRALRSFPIAVLTA
ncbi:MAG TPA: malto-oligosyltrehalose synthase [Acetobacteraceae bacterium]|nr:malto-oligosyltrehalose synthase [Acetobacteraceae bacterium]